MFLFVPSGDKTRTQSMVSIVFVVVVVLVLLTNTLQKESDDTYLQKINEWLFNDYCFVFPNIKSVVNALSYCRNEKKKKKKVKTKNKTKKCLWTGYSLSG